ncbi:nucleotide sugar dehydrogenase [Aquimarina rhabdastrellae]
MEISLFDNKIAVIGQGYVGLPLAVEFAKNGYEVYGFDINQRRIQELQSGKDQTREVEELELKSIKNKIQFTSIIDDIKDASIYIVTVPTPIDDFKKPNLNPLKQATKSIGNLLDKGNIVIYESTVFPGCTEEECVPILEKISGLKYNEDFYCGYSPERVNPGDKNHKVYNIIKVTSGSNEKITNVIDKLYKSIIKAGTYKASSIKVAEAAKVIENTQRDLNISLMNELALIFDKMNIDTTEVLEAAGTKWNFLPFRPGLVGGHCIGVDPYYLTYKAESLGYYPEVILSGRRINDTMGVHIANKVIKLMVENDLKIKSSKALVLGITFKENCPDIRNTRIVDVIKELKSFGIEVGVYDPYALKEEVRDTYEIELIDQINETYEVIILAVGHDYFKALNIKELKKDKNSVVFDVKSFLAKKEVTSRL